MKRIAVLAYYDAKGIVEDYVIKYIEGLSEVADKIIFVSDCEVIDNELEKVRKITPHIIAKRHGEYDFGSYKRGFLYAKENGLLNDCEELIFANDSCYAPLTPFSIMFDKMSVRDVDFWGATSNPVKIKIDETGNYTEDIDHIQSYFYVFKPQVFNSDVFKEFIDSIVYQEDKGNIIKKYEIGLTVLLSKNGFKYDTYSEISKEIYGALYTIYGRLIAEEKFPFLKRRIPLYKSLSLAYPLFVKQIIKKYTTYSYNIIEEDIKKNANQIKLSTKMYYFFRQLRKYIIRFRFNSRRQEIYIFGKKYDLPKLFIK